MHACRSTLEDPKAGYATGYFGKWHHDGQRDRPGFDRVASYVGQGRFNNCPFVVDGKDTPTQGWVDDVTTDYAIAFLKEQKDKPFDVVVGYKSPHGPRTPPPRAAQRFAGETARPAPNMNVKARYKLEEARGAAADVGRWGDAQLDYFRTVSAVDDNLGRILDALDELKIADRTLVVFASDNGYYLGEHMLGDKRSAYEESIRIPLLVRYPNGAGAGKVVDEMALNIDLAPTLLDYAGAQVPPEMQGRSLRPLLEGKPPREPWRKAFFYEYFLERRFNVPTTLAVRTTDAKLIRYPGHDDWTELYDLRADPYETKNLASNAAHADLLKTMQEEFDRQAKQVEFRVPEYAHERMPALPATRPRRRDRR